MPAIVGQGLIVVGGAISLFEFLRLARLYLRFYRAWQAKGDPAAESDARLEAAYEASKLAVIACIGLTLTFLGFVITAMIPRWSLLAPVLIFVSAAGNVLLFRWALHRRRQARSGQLR